MGEKKDTQQNTKAKQANTSSSLPGQEVSQQKQKGESVIGSKQTDGKLKSKVNEWGITPLHPSKQQPQSIKQVRSTTVNTFHVLDESGTSKHVQVGRVSINGGKSIPNMSNE